MAAAPTSTFATARDTVLQNGEIESPEAPDSSYVEDISAALSQTENRVAAGASLEESHPQGPDVPVAPANAYSPDDAAVELVPDVSFVRDARRQAFWRSPMVRVLLTLLALALTVLLAFQFAVQQRDALASLEPRLKPVLQSVCEVLGCKVGPVRKIEALVIDSSTFNKVSDRVYRLSFSIKSTAVIAVAMPSLEVTLTDTQDQAVIRRVLTPLQFGMVSGLLGPGGEFSGAVTLQLTPLEAGSETARRIAGYRLLAFYP